MSESAAAAAVLPKLEGRPHVSGIVIFGILLAVGVGYTLNGLINDIDMARAPHVAIGAFFLLGIALLIALGFEFVNGFHDTANAVATVIYTHSLPPHFAVVWSGVFNFLGVMVSSGAVAFSVLSLLPVELILQVGGSAGYAMIFSLLLAAITWNLGTWWLGLPASSSHTMVGSIIGVGLANQLLAPSGSATSGVDWSQAMGVFRALLISPVVGFAASALVLLAMKVVIKSRTMFEAPKSEAPPPIWIRGLLVLTCTGVSFAHGSNDGQKGMGLIMLILVGSVPTAYALNHAMPSGSTPAFLSTTEAVRKVFDAHAAGAVVPLSEARAVVTSAVRTRSIQDGATWAALSAVAGDIGRQIIDRGELNAIPAAAVQNVRNDMYLVSEAIRLTPKGTMSAEEAPVLSAYRTAVDKATKFIPVWVKVAVAIALGLGTMVGWKRIVVTVGEKIGKTHLTYGQGSAAELVAAMTIGAADVFGLPVSTTHVLSSGVAGTMAANGSGLQWSTVRGIAMAWVLTLPAAILLSGTLYAIMRSLF